MTIIKNNKLNLKKTCNFFFGGAIAVIAIGAFVLFEPGNDNSPAEVASTTGNNESDWLNEALISTAIEKPDLFTDAEIVAMIF